MTWGWRKRIKFGPFSLNLGRRGPSVGVKVGPVSTNSRTRRLRAGIKGLWVQSKGKVW